jgi:DNA (cytosine-5)-methyltransferase 1
MKRQTEKQSNVISVPRIHYERVCAEAARGFGQRESVDEPCKTVTTVGLGGAGAGGGDWYWILGPGETTVPKIDKPPYRVPTMAEIARIKPNGFRAISTFSGCGGSSLGYRMAGFKILWASEFVEAARESYAANMAPGTILDGRDIREVDPTDILVETGLDVGELDLLDGSPPCASFSTAGKRQAGWGQVKKYSDTSQRTDDLFFEFVRILQGLMPKTFVAENVSGLVKGTAKGYFLEILAALKDSGYRVKCKVLDAQWLGVPQQRQRTIFVGVREDLRDADGKLLEPAHPSPLPYYYSVRDAIPWITALNHDSMGLEGRRVYDVGSEPCETIRTPGGGANTRFEVESESDMSKYAVGREWDQLAEGEQSEKYLQLIRQSRDAPCNTVTAEGGNPSIASVTHPTERRKFSIAELRRICAFPDDFVLTGSYAQQWERLGRAVPPIMMRAIAEVVRDRVLRRIG